MKDPGAAVTDDDAVTVNGSEIRRGALFYYMLNKPAGIVTATRDDSEKTVLDLFPEKLRKGLSPVGRLDKDTVGLLLLTNDGALTHRLLAPRSHVDKVYQVRTAETVTGEDVRCFQEGMTLSDGTTLMPAELTISAEDPREALVRIREGKYHQIKRMFGARGNAVVFLKRLSMGPVTLDPDLAEGMYRELTAEELGALLAIR